jgi:hypothetical protein
LRVVYTARLLNSPDKTYIITSLTLSATAELAVGFLVLCIPTIPKLVQSSPILSAFFKQLKFRSHRKSVPNISLSSWIKAGAMGPQDNTGFSVIEEPALIATPGSLGRMEEKMAHGVDQTEQDTLKFVTVHEVQA